MADSRIVETHSNDILVFEENTRGHDFIVGDIHGECEILRTVLETLIKENDHNRVFFVGDLTDKGENSLGVINLILDYMQKYADRIFITRGNHENLCLQTIDCFEKLLLAVPISEENSEQEKKLTQEEIIKFQNVNKKIIETISHHRAKNGGEWLYNLMKEEVDSEEITIDQKNHMPIYKESSHTARIKNLMLQLPYIIHVKGRNPFHVVHAGMPFNDMELQRRLEKNKVMLDDTEKEYVTWAREDLDKDDGNLYLKNVGRGPLSIVAYTGHSIIQENGYQYYREPENTYNVDSGAFYYKVCLIANHTDKKLFKIGTGTNEYVDRIIEETRGNLNERSPSRENNRDLSKESTVLRQSEKRIFEITTIEIVSDFSDEELPDELKNDIYSTLSFN